MFEIGKEYNRRDEIHGRFNGQRQGGISTPQNFPVIFIFTSDAGEQHGYKDERREDGMFWYTGEGQVGDMKMTGGNKAILEHASNEKTIHLFESTRKAHVRYLGSAECLGYHEETRPDGNGDDRKAFIFHLDVDSTSPGTPMDGRQTVQDHPDVRMLRAFSLAQLRQAALIRRAVDSTPKEKRTTAFYRSEALKLYVVARTGGICEGCDSDAPFVTRRGPFLECHHVHRLADGGPDHPKNVVGLCPNCHRRAHYSTDAGSFNNKLKEIALEAEK